MKPFSAQFIECKKSGFNLNPGTFLDFKTHPEMLPADPRKRILVERSGVKGVQLISCDRFGGDCSSGHSRCKKLRESHEN